MSESHQVMQIAQNTYRILEEDFVNIYLLLGTERALLIDTGNGSGNLLEVLRSFTNLPLQIIATHGHADHLGGAGWFHDVMVHEADLAPVYTRSATPFASRIAAKMFGVKYRPVKKLHKGVFTPISLPLSMELGDRSVEAIHLPGHTAGSIGLLDRKNHMLFCGDAVGTQMQMMSPGTLPLEELLKTIDMVIPYTGDYTIWWGHYSGVVTKADLLALRREIQAVMNEQPENARWSKVKTSPNKLLTYCTGRVYSK